MRRACPNIVFSADDINAEFNRLHGLGVRFTQEPTKMEGGGPIVAVFDDTCGNLIQLVQA
jgi:predicted enzyme related to lactoylglutathione lyase